MKDEEQQFHRDTIIQIKYSLSMKAKKGAISVYKKPFYFY